MKISTASITEKVRKNKETVQRFLGYANRPVPKIIDRKIDEELANFSKHLTIEYDYFLHENDGTVYADLLYTVGDAIEIPIQQYMESSEAIRAMILDKIAIVALDEIKATILAEIFEQHGYVVEKELTPGSPHFPLAMQREIYDAMKNIRSIHINDYLQLHPVKSVALRLQLGTQPLRHNRCEDCQNPCDGRLSQEESDYLYFKQKAVTFTKRRYEEEGLPLSLFEDNIRDLDLWAKDYADRHQGILGIPKQHFQWIDDILELKIIKLGRLQFEILSPSIVDQYASTIRPNEHTLCLNVHIRAHEPFTPECCEASYRQAAEFFLKRGYSFSRIVFYCDSWLLNPKLNTLLSAPSHILSFQQRYQLLSEDPNNRQMEERVFGYLSESPDSYPQHTRLQTSLRFALSQNERFGTAQGFFEINLL